MWLLPPEARVFARGLNRRSFVSGSIFDSRGIHIAVVRGSEIFDLTGKKKV